MISDILQAVAKRDFSNLVSCSKTLWFLTFSRLWQNVMISHTQISSGCITTPKRFLRTMNWWTVKSIAEFVGGVSRGSPLINTSMVMQCGLSVWMFNCQVNNFSFSTGVSNCGTWYAFLRQRLSATAWFKTPNSALDFRLKLHWA